MRVMIAIAAVSLGLVACRQPEPTDGGSAEEQSGQAETAAAASTEPGNREEPKTETMSKITKTDEEWRAQLTEEQYRITRKKGTERAFTGKYWNNKEMGVYTCVCCGTPLFDSETKYESGTGWPSFWAPVSKENVATEADNSLFMRRTEVLCGRCDAHLGHVFEDGPKPTGLRYCINSAALDFKKKE